MKFIWFVVHLFGCPDKDISWNFKGAKGTCQKCGREYFRFEVFW